MRMNRLGRTDLEVSALCLGSMTWGSQNTTAEGHAQIDMALDHGINFIDTAEMYPFAPGPEDAPGATEAVIGDWFEKTGRRSEVILATKITGEGNGRWRDGAPISSATISEALDGSLARLKTDYVDLYQLHWPNRGSYHFRKWSRYDPAGQDADAVKADILDCLEALQKEVDRGRIRHIGLSNETAWGTQQFIDIAAREGLPRVATMQNEYSLLCRLFDLDMAETCLNEDVDLICYSPLAAGVLSGKYAGDVTPQGSRRARVANLGGRINDQMWPAHDAYLALAAAHGLDPVQMALAFCIERPFMGSTIFGATTLDQLKTVIAAADLTLSEDVRGEIDAIRQRHPMPM